MKQQKLISIAIALMTLMLSGCSFDFPLSNTPSRDINQKLLGDWKEINVDSKLSVLKFLNSEYLVVFKNGWETLYFRGFHSKVDKLDIVNLQLLNNHHEDYGKYSYFVIDQKNDNEFIVKSINVGFQYPDSRKLVLRRIKRGIKNGDLYDNDPMTFQRIEAPKKAN